MKNNLCLTSLLLACLARTLLGFLKSPITRLLHRSSTRSQANYQRAAATAAGGNKNREEDEKQARPLPSLWLDKHTAAARTRVANSLAELGLHHSVALSLLTDREQFERSKPSVQALEAYLAATGIDQEIKPSLSFRLLDNIKLLGKIQEEALDGADRRDLFVAKNIDWDDVPSFEEAERYMRYANAVYGDPIIHAANMDVNGSVDFRVGPSLTTRQRISEQIGIPEQDIKVLDVSYEGQASYLRHFIAVDHQNKKVVLAIRGTYNLANVVTDVEGYSRPFCGGQAHAAMASMTEDLWDRVGNVVVQVLNENEGYELILTGHSLGAGASNLLNILLHADNSRRVNLRQVRCFTFASPPVFAPLEIVPEAVNSSFNYIHEMDDVPFLHGFSIRHLFYSIATLEEALAGMDRNTLRKMANGEENLDESVLQAVLRAEQETLPSIEGVAGIAIPSKASVWLRETAPGSGKYNAKLCDSMLLSQSKIYLDPGRTHDHYPSRYVVALKNVVE